MNGHGFQGGALSWSRIERILSGRSAGELIPVQDPAFSALDDAMKNRNLHAIPWPELHARSSYSFLRGASSPEKMVETAVRLGLSDLTLTDRDGFYGIARFAEAAAHTNVHTIVGAELTLGQGRPALTVLCRGQEGYRRLSHVLTDARMVTGEKDEVWYPDLAVLAAAGTDTDVAPSADPERSGQCHWQLLADATWLEDLTELVSTFGASNVAVELTAPLTPLDADHNDELLAAAKKHGLRAVATTNASAATPADGRIAGAKAALAARLDLEHADPQLHPVGGAFLRSGTEMEQLFSYAPEVLRDTRAIAAECRFTLDLIAPNLPQWQTPDGYDENTWLRYVTKQKGRERYGAEADNPKAWAQIAHELDVIEQLGFPGYFLIVADICDFCREAEILAQGRGSAANSAVCFALGITNVDAVAAGLLFERFLSAERDGPPDIDLDIESGRREEVIQYVYEKYGRDNAAQVANVITYRRRGALRDAARALGFDAGQTDAWVGGRAEPPEAVSELAEQLKGHPRHLGIHSGGMVICDRPIADVVPTEWARMENRSVVQWDKDDCAAAGLVKFDLLGLGMLTAIHECIDLVAKHHGRTVNLWELDVAEPAVYEMLCRADAVGVFQVESRAQLATLPRLKPRTFYDLVVEVALIRPGPIQGGSVHPYIRRRNGEEPVVYEHPCLEPALSKTLGVPLFQEQLMQIAVDAAGFTPAEADSLRRAMGSKRSPEKMEALRARFFAGVLREHGIGDEVAQRLWDKIMAFASYGFPESHAQSFASIVFFSAWFKLHYPAEFCVALLRSQPMGFYSPQSLVADARRHGVPIDKADVTVSGVEADCPGGRIRLGLGLIDGLGQRGAERIVAAREAAPFRDAADLARRADLTVRHMEALANAGALSGLGLTRRQGLWAAGVAATEKDGMLEGLTPAGAPTLPGMSALELVAADLAVTGVTTDGHPMELVRAELNKLGAVPAERLLHLPDGDRILVAGTVTHRQRPRTASGVTFFGMEDETGLINVVVSPGLWAKYRTVAATSRNMLIRGIIQNANGTASVVADKLVDLSTVLRSGGDGTLTVAAGRSRDFR